MATLMFQAVSNKNNEALSQFFLNFNYVYFSDREEAEGFDEVYTDILYKQNHNQNYSDQYESSNRNEMGLDVQVNGGTNEQNPTKKMINKQVDAINQLMEGWENVQVEDHNEQPLKQKYIPTNQQRQVENYYQIYNAKKSKKNSGETNINHPKQDMSQNYRQNRSQMQFTQKQDIVQYDREGQNPEYFNNEQKIRSSKKQLKGANQFATYKRQLANLEDDQQQEKVIATQKPMKKRILLGNTEQTPKMKSTQIQRKDKAKSTRVYKIDNESIKKHSLEKQKQAEYQMMANIQFLRSLRGSVQSDKQKKEWKQSKIQNKNLIDELKNSRRKQLQSLGFVGQTSSILNNESQMKVGTTDVYTLNNSTHLLPELKQSRRKGQIFKPAAFSIYTIQKTNQLFYNNTK